MLDKLEESDFTPHLEETFQIHARSDTPVEAVLIEVRGIGSGSARRANAPRREPFSIVFRSDRDEAFEQGIYKLEHPEMGTLELFLVPIGPDEAGMRYEAVFN